VQFGKPAKARFLLGKDYFFVNHGAFGAASRSAFAAANCWREHAEVQPLKFIDRELLPLLVHTIREFAPFVNAMPEDLVFLPSATVGLNTVINAEARSWTAGDDVLSLSVGYNAVKKMLLERCGTTGARHIEVPVVLPLASADDIVQAVEAHITPATKFAVFDHVTSNTALVLPVDRLAKLCRARGVRVLIDGAHGAGMLDVDVDAVAADYYISNLHKWFCAPRGCAFMWAKRELQAGLRPLVVSHGSADGFTSAFIWDGNRDYSSTLAVLTQLEEWAAWDTGRARQYMHELARTSAAALTEAWGTQHLALAPPDMFGSMVMVGVPLSCAGIKAGEEAFPAHAKYVQDTLHHTYKIEVPVKAVNQALYVRISAHVYNHHIDYKALRSAISTMSNVALGKVTVCTKGGGC